MEINDSSLLSQGLQKAIGTDAQQNLRPANPGSPVDANESVPDALVANVEAALSDPEAVQEAVEKLGQFMETVSSSLKISVDDDLSKVVLRVVNTENDETIRQIPAEEVLDLMRRMRDLSEEFFGDTKGLLVENKV